MPRATPKRPRSTLLTTLLLWLAFYATFTLLRPALLDDADSVHVEVAREMLLRHDPVTLYANGIRYLEKAPVLYWSMAASMRAAMLFAAHRPGDSQADPQLLAAAARLPLALSVLALALLCESFARHLFRSTRAGLYAALILLSSFGIFIFTRITIPDAMVCLWITLALYCFWRTAELGALPATLRKENRHKPSRQDHQLRILCWAFAAACALNVLTKGLIGLVFPVGIVLLYLPLTRGLRRAAHRLRELHPLSSLLVFLAIAAPWHIAAGLANPTQGHPAPFTFVQDTASALPWGHWQVPLPTDGNVRGWWWFYFMNEHVLRYLNLRIPRDYDTVPILLFWGLCLIWLMPWSAFAFKAIAHALPVSSAKWRRQLRRHDLPLRRRGLLLLVLWAAVVLLFFSFSTRQEYYVLPALPALAILIAGWLSQEGFAYSRKHQSTTPQTKGTGFSPSIHTPKKEGALTPEAPTATTTASSRPEAQSAAAERPLYSPQRAPQARARSPWTRCVLTLLTLGTLFALATTLLLLHLPPPTPNTDLATQLAQNPNDYALSFGHILDFRRPGALSFFRLPLALAALSLFGGPLAALILRRRARPHPANLALTAGAFGFLLAAHLGLQTFAPVLSSAQLAAAIRPQLHPGDLVVLHGEYEAGSTLGFYLQRPSAYTASPRRAQNPINILEGRSSNLWYGSFFPDAPPIFETPATLAAKWPGRQRIFLWQSLTDPPNTVPTLPGPIYVLARSGGKEIVSNQPDKK